MPQPDPDDEPRPVAGVVVAGLLRLIAAGLEPIDTEPPEPQRLISVMTSSGWWLMLQIDGDGQPAAVHHAQPPSMLVPPWTWGCERDDWTLGPDSRVVTPVDRLTAEQRMMLRERLETAPRCWQFRPPPFWDTSNLDDEELILD